jgi:hypothetical protein
MQARNILVFAAIAILVVATVSMTTTGVLAAQNKINEKDTSASKSYFDSILAENGIADEDDAAEDEECDESDASDDVDRENVASANAVNNEEDEEEDAEDEDENEQEDEEENGTDAAADNNETEKDDEDDEDMPFDPCNFSSEVDNQYLPLSKYVGKTLRFAGNSIEDGSTIKVEEAWTVLSDTTEVADVQTLTIKVQEYENGELVEEALQYYAQGKDGVVYFFGEDKVDYEDGVAVENDNESWTVGDDTAVPGIAMSANPAIGIGFGYHSIDVPGIAHEFREVKSLNESISVQYGSFADTLQVITYEFDDGKTSQQFYSPGVGLVKEMDDEEEVELISIS